MSVSRLLDAWEAQIVSSNVIDSGYWIRQALNMDNATHTQAARIIEYGAALCPQVGDFVAIDCDLYCIDSVSRNIQTRGARGNWVAADVVPASWDSVADDWTPDYAAELVQAQSCDDATDDYD